MSNKRKGAARTAAPKPTTAKPAKGSKGGAAAAPAAPPLGHHIQPTGDRRRRFRKD